MFIRYIFYKYLLPVYSCFLNFLSIYAKGELYLMKPNIFFPLQLKVFIIPVKKY